ncbi:hypothetical protein HY490_01825, partial [Candidatus Woesearchaeota archaeon]|nr:hypothetical protein [Candidatus Woesearchaeota archaeon]
MESKDQQVHVTKEDIVRWATHACKFLVKHKTLVLLVLVLVLHFLPNAGYWPWGGMWMRLQTKGMLHYYQLAYEDVYKDMVSQIEKRIAEKYPGKTAQEKRTLASHELARRWNYYTGLMQPRIAQKAMENRRFFAYEQNGKIYSYLYNIDSYYFLRLARNLVEKGMYGDAMKGETEYDSLVTAPLGSPIVTPSLHPYVIAWTYRLWKLIDPTIPFMEAAGYLPLLFSLASIVIVFWLGTHLHSPPAGFFSALLFGLFGNGVAFTSWGNIDTDMYNLFFPVAILALLCIALHFLSWRRYAALAATGLFFGLYAFVWQGWWFLFDTVIAVLCLATVHEAYQWHRGHQSHVRTTVITLLILFVTTGVFVTLFTRFDDFASSFGNPLAYKESITSITRFAIWPNVYQTVQELRPLPLFEVVNSVGGTFLVGISIITL